MKVCIGCKVAFPATNFHRNRARPDGLEQRCKVCSKAHTYARRKADPEARRAKETVYRDATRERRRESWRRYQRKRRLDPAYRESVRRYIALWLKTPKGRAMNQAKRRRRRAIELCAPGHHTRGQLLARVAFYGGRCWICGATYQAIDHVKPLTKGGSEWPANLRPICWPCNSRKNDSWPFHR